MRQVPDNKVDLQYLVVGNGKLAKHFCHYLTLLNIEYQHWYRALGIPLTSFELNNKKIFILINDDAIEQFIFDNKLNNLTNSILLHCSGSLCSEYAVGVHPLMTFSKELYELPFYISIPFVIDNESLLDVDLLSPLENKLIFLPKEKKELYHLWCSMAGNFTSILWMNLFQVFNSEFGIDKITAKPYAEKIFENLFTNEHPLTGPLLRGDSKTIDKHLTLVANTPFEDVYNSFIKVFNVMKSRGKV